MQRWPVVNLHSSMDRLKAAPLRPLHPLQAYLHSSMDRLKDIPILADMLQTTNLHSSMDRLKAIKHVI